MATLNSWIKAARLRTLPLAISGIIVGSSLACFDKHFDWTISLLAFVTALFLQVFSNLANDYGDFQRGTDNDHRIGPTRTMQGGEIIKHEMKIGMSIVALLCLLIGFYMVYLATWKHSHTIFYLFLLFGALSLLAAYFYTAGKKSYGYIGLGDLFVFVFFGLLPVLGAYYLNTFQLNGKMMLPAIAIGCFSTGVLNLNNMRDIENDRRSGKKTIASRMGIRMARLYQTSLILFGWIAAILFTAFHTQSNLQWIFLLSLPIFIFDLVKIWSVRQLKHLDPFLKTLALSTLLFALLFSLGLILS